MHLKTVTQFLAKRKKMHFSANSEETAGIIVTELINASNKT